MIRDKNNNPAENRMNSIYYYYFEENLKERYPDRVTVISGDVTNRESFDKFLTRTLIRSSTVPQMLSTSQRVQTLKM